MNMSDPAVLLGNVFTVAGWLACLLFVVFYATRSSWRVHLVGRSLMYQSVALLLTLSVVIIGLWWPDMPGRVAIRLVCYGGLVFTTWRMFFTLLRYQREEDKLRSLMAQRSSGSTDTTV